MTNIHIGDNYVLLEPFVPAEVEKTLTYWHKEMVYDYEKFAHVVHGQTKRLYTLVTRQVGPNQAEMQLTTLPGFARMIKQALTAYGYPFTMIDERCVKPEADIPGALAGLREYQYEGAYTLIKSMGGIMSCPTGFGKTHVIGALCNAWPKRALEKTGKPLTVIVTPSIDIAQKNFKDLKEILGSTRHVGLICTDSKLESDDVQVVTPESMTHVPVEDCGLLVYDEVHTFTVKRSEHILRAEKAMKYGFSATPTGRFDNADLLTQGMFGPVVYHRTYKEAIADGAVVPIRVYWINVPKPEDWPETGFKKKDSAYRRGIWHCQPFHELVARVSDRIPADMQTLCVVDKIDHMNSLLPHIPDYTAVHAETSETNLRDKGFVNVPAVSKKQRRALYAQIENDIIKRIISTGIYRQGVNFKSLTALINVEGMGSEIMAGQLPGRTSRNIDGKDMAFILDFYRPWDMVTNARGKETSGFIFSDDRSRERVYTELGFDQIWIDDIDQIKFEA